MCMSLNRRKRSQDTHPLSHRGQTNSTPSCLVFLACLLPNPDVTSARLQSQNDITLWSCGVRCSKSVGPCSLRLVSNSLLTVFLSTCFPVRFSNALSSPGVPWFPGSIQGRFISRTHSQACGVCNGVTLVLFMITTPKCSRPKNKRTWPASNTKPFQKPQAGTKSSLPLPKLI